MARESDVSYDTPLISRRHPMRTTEVSVRREELDGAVREALNSLIGGQVIHDPGRPGGLLGGQVRRLWPSHYRANVLVGPDLTSARVAHSYFLTVDGNGNVIA